jgi:hypothetical protein
MEMSLDHRWSDTDRGENPTCSEKTFPDAPVSTTNWDVDWTGLDLVVQRCEICDAEALRSQSFEDNTISNAEQLCVNILYFYSSLTVHHRYNSRNSQVDATITVYE